MSKGAPINLSSKQLRAIRAVARYSSFIAAAAEMQMSQPGLSRIIRSAEEELGVDLFLRTTRKVVLTPSGVELLPIVDLILRDFDIAAKTLTSLRDNEYGHVAIACPMSIANRALANVIADYRKRFPNVVIDVKEALQGDVVSQVRSGGVDLGIAIAVPSDGDLVVEDLCETTYHVIFRGDHPFLQRKMVPLTALAGEQMISLPPSSNLRWLVDNAATESGFKINHVITVNTYNTIFELVRRGEGVSILNSAGIAFHTDGYIFSRPISPPRLTARLATLYLRSRPMSPAAVGLKQIVENYLRADFTS